LIDFSFGLGDMDIQVLLEKYFDVAFAAPNGIKKLRELILSLAMKGKLVAQDPHDVPASKLLKEIEAEKKRLVKDGKIKMSKPLPEIKPDEVPYDLPKSWEWVRLGDIGETNIGLTYAPSDVSDIGTPVLRSNNVQNGKLDLTDLKRVNKDIKENVLVQQGDLLICARNGSKALVGKTALITDLSESMAFGAFMAIFRSRINGYLLYFINSPLFRKMIDEVNTMTINQITQNNLKTTILPLPPLAEQRRIVAKIDELMARCDELEKLRGNLNQKQITVHNAALNRLLTAKDQSDFNTAWQFITQHFGDLYSVKENVAELRKAILQLAVMGKLVPQDPSDRPASELLKEIVKEKERLVKEEKIKKSKSLPSIESEEIPFRLPNNWQWVRLGEIASKITDGEHLTPPRIAEGYRLLSAKNIRNGYLDFDNVDFISEEHYLKSRERCCPEFNDLLIVSVGGTIGRSSLVPEDSFFALVRSVAMVKPLLVNSLYLKYSMDSNLLQSSIHTRKRGGAQPCLYLSEIEKFLFSLPPLAEQHRIVAKCDRLMTLCDNLEKQIDENNSKKTNLLNAVMTKV
jgi:type I restriction enzyme S subunit